MFTRAVLLNHLKDNKNTTAMGDAHEEVAFRWNTFLPDFWILHDAFPMALLVPFQGLRCSTPGWRLVGSQTSEHGVELLHAQN